MKYSKKQIDEAIKKLTDSLISTYGLRNAKKIVAEVKRNYAAETKRRKNL